MKIINNLYRSNKNHILLILVFVMGCKSVENIIVPSQPFNTTYFLESKKHTKTYTVLDSALDSIVYHYNKRPNCINKIVPWKNNKIEDCVYHIQPCGDVTQRVWYEEGIKVSMMEHYKIEGKYSWSFGVIGKTKVKLGRPKNSFKYDSSGKLHGIQSYNSNKPNKETGATLIKMENYEHGVLTKTIVPNKDGGFDEI